ncbi:MAG: hypothetical protein CSB55_02535 [Candidatus Cloacimonadota bacterium]|nr:MAG: hypothetical protein CSB55_02535 [Candidatus Cloacimonadota bacterium]
MKSKFIPIIFVIASFFVLLNADEKVIFDKNDNIVKAAAKYEFPVKKMVEYLDNYHIRIDLKKGDGEKSLKDFNIDEKILLQAKKDFEKYKVRFGLGITLVGMLVVFISLMLIGIIISQMEHITKYEERKRKKKEEIAAKKVFHTSCGKISTSETEVSMNSIAAVITALHIHRLEAEESHKLHLTWKRTPVSVWRASFKTMMPNKEYNYTKRTR